MRCLTSGRNESVVAAKTEAVPATSTPIPAHRATGEEARRGISAPRYDRNTLAHPAELGHRRIYRADNRLRLDDAGQFCLVEIELLAEL